MPVLQVEDGDLYLPAEKNTLTVLGEPQATLQGLRDALRVAVGDWFLDLSVGVNREVITGKLASMLPPEVEIRRVLSRVRGVTQVIRVRARRLRSLAEAQAANAEAAWNAAPNRVLFIEAEVTSRTAGTLDLGLAFTLAST